MEKVWPRLAYFAGILCPFWLLVGVSIAGALYPGYSHSQQALSELGAVAAPTHSLSPLINNLPLGLLLLLFGGAVVARFPLSLGARLSGLLIALHGLASIGAGFFPCDVGCNPVSPSPSQLAHNGFGAMMFLSLLLASAMWVWLSRSLLDSPYLFISSIIGTALALLSLVPMAQAITSGENFGLYQRINYGAQLVWVAALALALLRSYQRRPV